MTSRSDTLDGDFGGDVELNDPDSGGEEVISPRRRPPWTQIWRTSATETLEVFRTTIPTHAIDKSNEVGCTINHLRDQDYDLHRCSHTMRSQMVSCRSDRCKKQQRQLHVGSGAPPRCPCRYKFKICLSSSTSEVFQQGDHVLDINDPPSPVERQLTQEMKDYILQSLSGGEKTTAARLHSLLCALIDGHSMAGPAPKPTQVADFIKNWRRRNPKDSMAPLIALCDGHLYDQIDVESYADTAMVIMCDAQATPDESGEVVSHLGDGSSAYPLRVGMTCLRLVRDYVAVQSRLESTTILHLDSTHSMVINGFSVFVFGYSDRAGHFFPLVYYCTSQKRAVDVGWCIGYLKRVCLDACGVDFKPTFVMMDADKAQFNACVSELPRTVVLMCWFHVMQNVWKHVQAMKVPNAESAAIFADMYDLHYAREDEFQDLKAAVLLKWQLYAQGSLARKITDHITKWWLSNFRFNRWQAFRTPSGYAATNNPLEQYHKVLKIQCPGGPATPSELLRNLNGARLSFLNRDASFVFVPTASERLTRLYRLLYSRGCFSVQRLPAVGSVAADLYKVNHKPLQLTAAEKKLVAHNVRSVNARRMQLKGMPDGGWIVDTRSKACSCPYSRKHGLCCHIICACIQAGVACPGISTNTRRFVRPNHVHGAEDSDDMASESESVDTEPVQPEGSATEDADDPYRHDLAISPPVSPALSVASTISFASLDEEPRNEPSQAVGNDAGVPTPGPEAGTVGAESQGEAQTEEPTRRSRRRRTPTRRALESLQQSSKRSRR